MVRGSWFWNLSSCGCKDISYPFFIKPKLSINYDRSDPNNYAPTLELIGPEGRPSGIIRKFIKVKVTNHGRAIAHSCRGELRVISGPSRHPTDTKRLCWDNENNQSINIGVNRYEFLHIVFADSNFPAMYQGIVPGILASPGSYIPPLPSCLPILYPYQ
jgi:hypothetical protein